jgi:hypothetical protein
VAGKGFEGGDVAGKMVGGRMVRRRQRQQQQAQVVTDADAAQQRLDRIGFGSTPQKSWNGCRRASHDPVASWSWAAASSHIRR